MQRDVDREVELIVIRHGETVWNTEGRIQGHLDSPLSENGIAQAIAIGRRLAGESLDALYTSDLGRAYSTARHIARHAGGAVRVESRLRERNLGILQALTRHEADAIYPEIYKRYMDRDPEYVIPGGESARQCFDRTISCFKELASIHPGQRILLVTHGGVLGNLYRHVVGIPLNAPRDYTVFNASLNVFRYRNGRWVLEVWGDVAHIEKDTTLDDA